MPPFIVNVAPLATVSEPVPVSVPPLQVPAPDRAIAPLPCSVPPERFNDPIVIAESIVAVPDERFTVFPSALIVPPLALSVVVPSTTAPAPLTSESELNTRFSCPMVEVMLAFRLMLLWALSVSVASVPAVLLIALATVMSPA